MSSKNLYYISIQSNYHLVEFSLYNNKQQLEMRSLTKIDASSALVPSLDELLKTHGITSDDLSFIAVNQGPAPFTTLRVVIATVNGISFATKIPLIGIDGLKALLLEQYDPHLIPTVALLNAFSHEVYYGIQTNKKMIQTGCKPITVFLNELIMLFPTETIRFIGNGVKLYKETIRNIFKTRALMHKPIVETCSVEQIARMGLDCWNASQGLSTQILPLYLKKQWRQQQEK